MTAYAKLPEHKQRFVEALLGGATLEDAARAGGSTATTSDGLKRTAARWRDEAGVQDALAEREGGCEVLEVSVQDDVDKATETLRQVMGMAKSSPTAAVRAAKEMLTLRGVMGRKDVRHLHAHVGVGGVPALPEGEEERMLSIALRGRKFRCPSCGAEVELDLAEGSGE